MAMQSGIGVSKILVLAGAGYTTTILFKNNKLSDLLGELQSLVKGYEKGDQSEGDSEYADAIAAQVRRLASEVRQLASARQITVLNGGSGFGNFSSLIGPAAAAGALGYGYMWWKGLSFSDLMYVTKKNMATAVTNLTKHLENVSDALAKTKKHLTQRIQNLDDKMGEQNALSRSIKADVGQVNQSLSQFDTNLGEFRIQLSNLTGRMGTMEEKQNLANMGVLYLCDFVDGRKGRMPEQLREQLKISGKPRGLLGFKETPSLMDVKLIADSLSGGVKKQIIEPLPEDSIGTLEEPQPKNLLRSASTRC